jgi:hypothetical protein
MAKTIPQLTDATTVNAADELIIQQSGITKRATGAELAKGLNTINGTVNVRDFGAVGDGVTDDTAAIQAAINSSTGVVFFPEGQYRVNGDLTASNRISLAGEGSASQINYYGTGTLLTLNYSQGGAAYEASTAPYEIRNIRLFKYAATGAEVAECCIELKFTGTAAVIGADDKLYVDNVYIGTASFPSNIGGTYWKKGIFLNRSAGVYITNTSIANASGTAETASGVYGIHIKNDLSGHAMIRCLHATNLYVQNFNRCVFIEEADGSIESIYISNGEMLGNYGVYANDADAIAIDQDHFDVITQAFYFDDTNVTRVTACDIRSQRVQSPVANALIYSGGDYATWTGNVCFGQNQSTAVFETAGTFCTISNNVIVGYDPSGVPTSRAVIVSAGSASVFIVGNSTANVVGTPSLIDNSGSASVFYSPSWKWETNGSTSLNGGKVQMTLGGFLKASQDGTYYGAVDSTNEHQLISGIDAAVARIASTNVSYTGTNVVLTADRSANSAYNFFLAFSDHDGTPDAEFVLRGDGEAFADGAWTGGGADYAEYFEWQDGNPDNEDRRGMTVVFVGEKIRKAVDGEQPIGAVSAKPSIVGNSAWNKWHGKYETDEFGGYVMEDYDTTDADGNTVTLQRRKLNSSFDTTQEYVPRSQRKEWSPVGLLGRMRIIAGQPTSTRWHKLCDVSANIEEWLVK